MLKNNRFQITYLISTYVQVVDWEIHKYSLRRVNKY